MFRLFCFNVHAYSPKPKKAMDPSVQPMQKTLHGSSQVSETRQLSRKSSLSSLLSEGQSHSEISRSGKDVKGPISLVQRWISDEIRVVSDLNLSRATALKKSQSDGIEVCNQGGILAEKHEMDLAYSSDFREDGELKLDGSKDKEASPVSQQQCTAQSVTDRLSSVLVNESLFTIGDSQHSEDDSPEKSQTILFGEARNQFGNGKPLNTPIMIKSRSLPMMGASTPRFGKRSSHSTSCEDLRILDMRKKDVSSYKVHTQEIEEVEDDEGYKTERKDNEYYNSLDGNDCCNYSALANSCLIPAMDEVNLANNFHQDPAIISKEFKLARIEEWVNDLQHCGLEEEIKFSGGDYPQRSSTDQNESYPNGKVDLKASPGMEAAKNHISSLSASATMAQLANLGLVAIPILSAFVSLKVLNLSGNAIVRITAGALPRGLHALNLSKNSISVIEGLRELTRLRVLDLSYNRILRIGHGLASCSSLKELYLVGNKISEVEGLHRLLKLIVLDLGFNKISTAKCLGQLAANYNSLQAISLEGNPAQKNVGDDQLKKHLLGLLPNLVYFNRQPMKTSTLKDTADRAVRLGVNAHQFERGLRSDNKALRKATRVASGPRPLSLSTYGRKSLAVSSTKLSRARHGNKASTNHHHNYFDLGNRLSSDLLIRKSQSAGNLGAL